MVSIVIVNYNTRQLTQNCIQSIMQNTYCDYEILVVDNSSRAEERYISDSSLVRVIPAENKGFGHACNMGIRAARGDFYLMLNSDTLVHERAIDRCLEYLLSHPEAGAAGCKTLLKDGSLDHNCKRGLPTPEASLYYLLGLDKKYPHSPKYARYHATYLDENKIQEVEVLSGSFMLLRKEALRQTGLFDEQFFMYCEDVDLCYRITKAGWKIVYLPSASILHLKGQSGLHTKNRKIIVYFHTSMLLFYKKHFRKEYPFFVTAAVYLGVYLKLLLSLFRSFF